MVPVKYLLCLLFPAALQVMVTFLLSQAGPSGGFAGLGALLFALVGIPLTMIINFVQIRANRGAGALALFGRSLLLAMILPAIQIALLIAVSVLRL